MPHAPTPHEVITTAEAALQRGEFHEARRLLKRVLISAPGNSRAQELMAYLAADAGDLATFESLLLKATRSPAASASAWHSLGQLFRRRGDLAHAIESYERGLQVDARHFPALHDLGTARFESGDASGSLDALADAERVRPGTFEVAHNMGRALHALGRFDEALARYDRALQLEARHPGTLVNRGEVLNDLRRYEEALADFRKALELDPQNADASWNSALTMLLLGRFEEGWELYESRWEGPSGWRRRHDELPLLQPGESPAGRRVLVWWEQGFGDTLHFCRYVPMLAKAGAKVVFEVQPALAELMGSLGECGIARSGDVVSGCEVQIPLLSLPRYFGTREETIPKSIPYLRADAARIEAWGRRLGPRGLRERIAVACSGNPNQKDDRYRSMPVEALAPLAAQADVYLVQPACADSDRDILSRSGITFLGDRIADFSDSAAILAHMDRVVTIDTALAHLAGALGRPTVVLLPFTPTWRWMADRDDSPWYPGMRLVRQSAPGDWAPMIDRIVREREMPCCS